MFTKQQVAATMDHAVLKPFATDEEIIKNAKMCDHYGVASLCVRPSDGRAGGARTEGKQGQGLGGRRLSARRAPPPKPRPWRRAWRSRTALPNSTWS